MGPLVSRKPIQETVKKKEEAITFPKEFRLDPTKLATKTNKEKIKDIEKKYFAAMTSIKVDIRGSERLAGKGAPSGTTAVTTTVDGKYVAVASRSGWVRIWSIKDLALKSIARTGSPAI